MQKNITITHDNTSLCNLPNEGPRFGKLARETCDKSSRQLIVIITTIITATTIVFITIMEINGNYNPSTCAKTDALKSERAIKSPISLAHLSPKWLSRLVTPSSAALPQVQSVVCWVLRSLAVVQKGQLLKHHRQWNLNLLGMPE